MRETGSSAAVGQTCTQLPQNTHEESAIGPSNGVPMCDSKPRPTKSIACAPTISSHARTQRPHRMQYW